MTKPTTTNVAIGAIAAMLAGGGAWLTGQTVDSSTRVATLESTTTIELQHINDRLDRHEAKLDALLARSSG